MMLHYYSNLDVKVVSHHFSEIFHYAKVKGEELPIIEPKNVPKVSKGDEQEVMGAFSTIDIPEARKGDKPRAVKAVLAPIITKAPSQS